MRILGAIFCHNEKDETKANLKKPKDILKKIKEVHGHWVSLQGKILQLNTHIFSTIWNNAWLLNTKDDHFKDFVKDVAGEKEKRYLKMCQKGK